jgi:hypothetical protein
VNALTDLRQRIVEIRFLILELFLSDGKGVHCAVGPTAITVYAVDEKGLRSPDRWKAARIL